PGQSVVAPAFGGLTDQSGEACGADPGLEGTESVVAGPFGLGILDAQVEETEVPGVVGGASVEPVEDDDAGTDAFAPLDEDHGALVPVVSGAAAFALCGEFDVVVEVDGAGQASTECAQEQVTGDVR